MFKLFTRGYSTYKAFPQNALPQSGKHPVAYTTGPAAKRFANQHNLNAPKVNEGYVVGNWSHSQYNDHAQGKFSYQLSENDFFISNAPYKAKKSDFKKIEKLHPETEHEIQRAAKSTMQQKQNYGKKKEQENVKQNVDKQNLGADKKTGFDTEE